MNIVFTEHKPDAVLAPFVQAFWFGDFNIAAEGNFEQSVVPNGCIELIIHLTRGHCALTRDQQVWHRTPPYTLLGMHTHTYKVRFSSRVNVFGIRFYPDGIRSIFGISPVEFLRTYEDGLDVLGAGIDDFCRRVSEASSDQQRLILARSFIKTQLARNFRPWDYTHQAMKTIRELAGLTAYGDLTAQIAISERQLQREFKQQYGITVGDYMRLARMNAIYQYMQTGAGNLTKLSNELEFFDQAHFIREFKSHVGTTPGRFARNRDQFIVNQVTVQLQ